MSDKRRKNNLRIRLNSDGGFQLIDAVKNISTTIEDINDVLINDRQNPLTDIERSMAEWWKRGWHNSFDFHIHSRTKAKRLELPFEFQGSQIVERLNGNKKIRLSSLESEPVSFESLKRSLLKRRSMRRFGSSSIDLERLSNFIKQMYGGFPFHCPSSKKAFPCYLAIFKVTNIEQGLYYFDPDSEFLYQISKGYYADEVSKTISGLPSPKTACATIYIAADMLPLAKALQNPSDLKFIYYVSGLMCQRLLIRAAQDDVFGVPTPALSDSEALTLFGCSDSDPLPIYSVTIGRV